jgi:hypothetical protein
MARRILETQGYAIVVPFREMGFENGEFDLPRHVIPVEKAFPAWKIRELREVYEFRTTFPERFEQQYARYITAKIGMSYTLIVNSLTLAELLNRKVMATIVPSYACMRKRYPRFIDYASMCPDHETWIQNATAIYYKTKDAHDYIYDITDIDY